MASSLRPNRTLARYVKAKDNIEQLRQSAHKNILPERPRIKTRQELIAEAIKIRQPLPRE